MINPALTFFLFLQESTGGVISPPSETLFEPLIINLVSWLRLFIETTGAVIISIGIICAIYEVFKALRSTNSDGFTRVRLLLARYLALALEFQLAADILSTAIAPTWDQIGKLAAIAVIRTALNFFLSREMEEEKKIIEAENTIMDDDKAESET
ncbi:MAG: DUF1622 domain-containing protein [Acidobacteriota bacterium]|nr:DUF1622 domain-containing protein [Acidobacteriota bacterium]